MDTIFIDQLKVEALIGVYEQERVEKQVIYVDLEMQYDSDHARASDNIKYALDYHKISLEIEEFVSDSAYELIETLAHAIADMVMKNNNIEQLKLTLSKPQALANTNNVGIIIHKSC